MKACRRTARGGLVRLDELRNFNLGREDRPDVEGRP